MNRQVRIIVPMADSFQQFRRAVEQPELPVIDIDAVLDCVVDAVSCRIETTGELLDKIPRLLYGSELLGARVKPNGMPYMQFGDPFSLHEEPDENIFGLQHVTTLAQRLGLQLQQQFEAYRLYQNGELAYEFDGIVDEHAIALRARSRR